MGVSREKPLQGTIPQLDTMNLQLSSTQKESQENCAEIGQIFISSSGGATDFRMDIVKTCLPNLLSKKYLID